MKVAVLIPPPQHQLPFKESQYFRVPTQAGCYVLSTLNETILYIGLSNCLARRFNQHLDTPDKIKPTPFGRAIWFHWLIYEDVETLERTWLNEHEVEEGRLPYMNNRHSPMFF